jgi:small subunit ribosomal protein S7
MSRRHAAEKRKIIPDAKYGDLVVARFTNYLTRQGKKSAAERIIYSTLDELQAKTKKDPLEVFKAALDNVKPSVEVRSRRVGGATYQVPVEVRSDRALQLSMRWVINAANNRGEKTMKDRLSNELLDAFNQRGTAIKKREDTHKMADANKAFSHYRW